MVKEIELSQGMVALVDDADFEELASHKWYVSRIRRTYYAKRNEPKVGGGQRTILMHRVILNAPPGMQVDHINGDGLNNRRYNLRLATNRQNGASRKHKQLGTSSSFLGVYWQKCAGKWRSEIKANGTQKHIGYFDSEIDAAFAYNEAALELHGKFASINDLDNPGELISAAEQS